MADPWSNPPHSSIAQLAVAGHFLNEIINERHHIQLAPGHFSPGKLGPKRGKFRAKWANLEPKTNVPFQHTLSEEMSLEVTQSQGHDPNVLARSLSKIGHMDSLLLVCQKDSLAQVLAMQLVFDRMTNDTHDCRHNVDGGE